MGLSKSNDKDFFATDCFIDCTKREICSPSGQNNLQRAVYHERLHEHNLGFQGAHLLQPYTQNFLYNIYFLSREQFILSFYIKVFYIGLSDPHGMIIDLAGPYAGRHNDMVMFRESNINNKIIEIQLGNAEQYVMYADKGHINKSHINAAYHGQGLTQKCNKRTQINTDKLGVK